MSFERKDIITGTPPRQLVDRLSLLPVLSGVDSQLELPMGSNHGSAPGIEDSQRPEEIFFVDLLRLLQLDRK